MFLFGCRKVDTIPSNPSAVITDVFKVSDVTVSNGQPLKFNLTTSGTYTLTLYDTTINQVISKEKFSGATGNNTKTIYTKSFNQKSLYLYISDSLGNQIGKTKLTIN